MWDDAIRASQLSVAPADERMKRKHLGLDTRNYHSLQWLSYAYLQEGRESEARAVIDGIEKSGYTRGLPLMRITA